MKTLPTAQRVARNAGALYVVQFVSFLVPVFEIPILAHALGPAAYGQILFCQALALAGSLLVEYGFNINAAQQAAVAREQRVSLNRLFSQVLLAKIVLAIPLVTLILVAWGAGLLKVYLDSNALLMFVLAYFFAFGFSPMWYFQGREKMVIPALLDVVLRLCGLAVLAMSVRSPDDFLLSLPILAVPPLVNTSLTIWWGWHEVGSVQWDFRGACRQIHDGFHFFVYRSASNLAMSSIPVFLGFSAGKRAVGEFAPPEKLIKGMISLVMPFLLAVFPTFSRQLNTVNGANSFRASILVLVVIGLLAILGAGLGVLLGPWVLAVLLGNGFPGSLEIYYGLIALVPLRIVNQSIAMVLLIPAGRSKSVSYVISVFSVLAVVLGTGLSFRHGGLGMAGGLVGTEAILFLIMVAMATKLVMQDDEKDWKSNNPRHGGFR